MLAYLFIEKSPPIYKDPNFFADVANFENFFNFYLLRTLSIFKMRYFEQKNWTYTNISPKFWGDVAFFEKFFNFLIFFF